MEINKSIFKSYDIRGIYSSELNENTAFVIGAALVRHTGAKRVVIGQDARISSPALFKALARGVFAGGAQVTDIGQVPTECVYFALGSYDFDTAVMITASHNPKEYNGFKMIRKIGHNLEMVRGTELASIADSDISTSDSGADIDVPKKDIWNDFIKNILSFVDLSEITPLKVVIDASNGVAGNAISRMQDKLPVEIVPLNFDPDGNFPNHSPNPLIEGSADKIKQMVKTEKADFGLIFDADADRIFLIDEEGEMVRADVVLLLLAKYFLEKNQGMAIAYNAICSKATQEFIKKWGGKPIRTKVGFVNVREGLMQNNGIMGGELSGHYCFKDNFYMDSGMIALLTLLVIFSKDQGAVSEIVKDLSPYAKSSEFNFQVSDKTAVIEEIKQKYSDGEQDFLDGVTVTYKDWWFNLRPSNTEPLLRLTIEADTKELLDEKQEELKSVIIE